MTWHRHFITRLRIPAVALALLVVCLIQPAHAQSITLSAKGATLAELTAQLEPLCGYEFRIGSTPEFQTARHDFSCHDQPFVAMLDQISALYHCDFFSIDSQGFYIVPAKKPVGEVAAGPYRLRFSGPFQSDEDRSLHFTMMFSADTAEQMEAIAGVGADLRIIDNFGRPMFHSAGKTVRSTSGIRARWTEYWLRIPLSQTDEHAIRIRSVKGSIVLYRKVIPVRLELPLTEGKLPREMKEGVVTVRLEKVERDGDDCTVAARLSWPGSDTLLGRGVSRTPLPYLVDDHHQVVREFGGTVPHGKDAQGNNVWDQHLRFEGVRGKPHTLVYDLFLKEDPTASLQFQLSSIPLPAAEVVQAPNPSRPFFEHAGGSVSFLVKDRNGDSMEGEVSLGISRKTPTGWSALHWVKLITDPAGHAVLEHVQPGTYRLIRQFRANPGAPPLPTGERPLELAITAQHNAMLSPLLVQTIRPRESQ